MTDQTVQPDSTDNQPAGRVTRRSLFRAAGVGAAVVGGGALLEACSSGIQGASSSSSSASGAASGSSGGGASKEITIGWIHPVTGSLAGFGYPDNWVVKEIMATPQFKNGIKIGGSTYTVNIKSYDTQSSVTKAGSLAKQAIQQDNVDLLLASSTPETVNAVASQADALPQAHDHVLPRRRAPRARLQADVGPDRREVRQQPHGGGRVPERLRRERVPRGLP